MPFDITQRTVPPPRLIRRAWLSAPRLFRFARLLASKEVDVLVSFSSGGLSLVEKSVFARLARIRGIPTLLWIRDGNFMAARRRSALWRWFARLLLRPASRMLCQGDSWREFYVNVLEIPGSRCTVIENWLSDESLLSVGKDRSYAQSTTVTFLYLGWIETAKGAADLFEAFHRLCA
ncbi:MAG TPA: glycosyltransferase, partial [Gemmatimonadaceae bacterium]|nr:glycosyltransferase [Gemmatimonadaceae bacterium]